METEEHLDAIRNLLDRAGIYRAISARIALVGGLLSLALSSVMLGWQTKGTARNIDARSFFDLWSLVFVFTLGAAGYFLSEAARRRGEPLMSPSMKLALASVAPSLFAGVAISACLTLTSGLPLFPTLFWLVFYGLALLSMRQFSPAAISMLGWAFLITGVGAFVYMTNETNMPEFELPTPANYYPAAIMGATFGIYHLIYAAATWPRRTR